MHHSPTMSKRSLLTDPERLRQPPPGFECGETILIEDQNDDDETEAVGAVSFYCTLPAEPTASDDASCTFSDNRLTFSCRGRSVGALLPAESSVDEDQLDEAAAYERVDPFLFNDDYTPAGKTGFQVWAGTRLLIECLSWPIKGKNDSPSEERISYYQQKIACGANVLELGSGVGVMGTVLAAVGANVLLTDLPTLVDHAVWPNIVRNTCKKSSKSESFHKECPSWLAKSDAIPVARGWAAAAAMDWTKPIDTQLPTEQIENIDLIVASDCVWLVSMLDALLDTASAVFKAAKQQQPPAFLMSFQRRDASGGDDSALFTTVDRVLESIEARGWTFDCLAWRPVRLDDGEGDKEVFVFEIKAV